MSYDELKEEAKRLGLEVKGNAKREDIEEAVRVAQEEETITAKNTVVEAAIPAPVKKVTASTEVKPMTRQEAMEMVKVKITPLDEALKGLASDMYTVANQYIGTVTQVVVFNKPKPIFKVIVEMLRATQMPIGTPQDNGTVLWDMVDAFSVTEVPLTEEELEALKAK